MLSLQNYGSSSETDSDTENSEPSESDSSSSVTKADEKSTKTLSPVVPAHLQPIVDPAMSLAKSLAVVAAPEVVAAVSKSNIKFIPK